MHMTGLSALAKQLVMDYAADSIRAKTYFVEDAAHHVFAVLDVPDHPRQFPAAMVLMARIVDDYVVIEHDIHDRPLWQALVRAGVPRDKIILAYIGETVTASPTQT
jgi:hypothetical protein